MTRRAQRDPTSIITELGNHAALALYRDLGFTEVEGLATLSLGLGQGD